MQSPGGWLLKIVAPSWIVLGEKTVSPDPVGGSWGAGEVHAA